MPLAMLHDFNRCTRNSNFKAMQMRGIIFQIFFFGLVYLNPVPQLKKLANNLKKIVPIILMAHGVLCPSMEIKQHRQCNVVLLQPPQK